MREPRAILRWAGVAAIAALAVVLQWAPTGQGRGAALEHLVRDPLHEALASPQPESRITVIDLDEASIAATGPWPWPRARVADLLEALATHYGARAVGVDIVFPAPADAAGDARIAALSGLVPVVLAQAMDFVPRRPSVVSGTPVFRPPVQGLGAVPATGFVANHPGLATAGCVGNIGLQPDADGRIRRVPLVASWEGQASPLLPLAMLACPLQARKPALPALPAAGLAQSGGLWELPLPRRWEAYTIVPAAAILDGSAPQDLVRGRWVLVGSSALGLNDRAPTPLAASAAGVMVHASALSALLDRIEGSTSPLPFDGRLLATAWTLLTLAAAGWALGRLKAVWLVPLMLAAAVSWLGVAAWLLGHGALFSASGPLLAYLLLGLVVALELWLTQREQGRILRSFATYVAPSVLARMLQQGIDNPMTPQHGEITVISADMQDYTGLTQRLGLQETAQLTREFLQCLTAPILDHGGTLDKYTGDGLVAFWGAPLPTADHAGLALRAAQAIVGNVRAWNEGRVRSGRPPARVRIGIESGPVLVGDLGTRFRRTYTAVGDCINTASKLQAVAKTLRCDVVIGPVAASLAGREGLAPVANVQLPGHTEASQLWSFPNLGTSLPDPVAASTPAATLRTG